MLTSKQLRRRLLRLIDVVCDEAESNSEFLSKLEQAWAGTKEPASQKRVRKNVPDPFAMITERGPGALKPWLESFSVEQLRDIVRAHRLDPSRLSDKWKSPERFVELIEQRVMARTKQGEVFRTYRSSVPHSESDNAVRVSIEAAEYSREYKSVIIQAALENQSSRPNTLKDVLLKVGDSIYRPSHPPSHLFIEGTAWFPQPTLRLDSWGAERGAWYFGGKYGSNPIELTSPTAAKLLVSPVRGATAELKVELFPPSSAGEKLP